MFTNNDHTFSVCAYKESPYLEECIESVARQKSKVIVCTSTPNDHIKSACEKYGVELFVREGKSNIAEDWNFAIDCADTPLVTIAHQDDIYKENYAEEMLKEINSSKSPIMFFSDYGELRDGVEVRSNKLLRIKRILKFPARVSRKGRMSKRMIIAFGNSICCPSVTYVKEVMSRHHFIKGMRSNIDWQMWEELSREKGSFANSGKILMLHRIHEESETSHVIGETGRDSEDFEMFRKFWPDPLARMLAKKYKTAEESNKIK